MGCGPMLEFSGAMREIEQAAQFTGQQQQFAALQAQMSQQAMAQHYGAQLQQTMEQHQRDLEARGLVRPPQVRVLSTSTYEPWKQLAEPTLEGVHIDDAPLLDWLKFRIDKCWHRGIELMEKAARTADEALKELKEAFVPKYVLRNHAKLTGVGGAW